MRLARKRNFTRLLGLTLAIVGMEAAGDEMRAQSLELAGRPPSVADGAPADRVDAYLVGLWHLAQAVGRAQCDGAVVTPQLRTLTTRDFEWVQRGMEAGAGCPSATARTVMLPIPSEAMRMEELRETLRQLRADYQQLANAPGCSPGLSASDVRAIALPIYAVSEAAAETVCQIASWHKTLPPPGAREVLRHVENARESAAKIHDPKVRAAFTSQLAPLPSQISTLTGEAFYHSLVGVVTSMRELLRRTR